MRGILRHERKQTSGQKKLIFKTKKVLETKSRQAEPDGAIDLTAQKIRQCIAHPSRLASLLSNYRLSYKLQRQRDEDYRVAIANAVVTYREIEKAKNKTAIIKELHKNLKGVRPSNDRAIVLHAFIEYDGSEQRQYLSRDKAALSLFCEDKRNLTVSEFCSLIKKYGGIKECAARFRKLKRRKTKAKATREVKLRTLSALCPAIFSKDGDCGMVVVMLEDVKTSKFLIVDAMKSKPFSEEQRQRYKRRLAASLVRANERDDGLEADDGISEDLIPLPEQGGCA